MHDVVIVGAGPVGKFLACRLSAHGLDVRVVERRTDRITHSRAIGIHPPALAALADLGVAGDLIDRGVTVRRGILRSRGADAGSLTFERASTLYPFVLTIPQHVTERVLERKLDAVLPGALTRGFEVTDVVTMPDHVEVAGPDVLCARYVVGADGPTSIVREAAGIPTRALDLADTYLMGDFADSTTDGPRAVIHVEPAGVVESFPLPGGMRRWVVRTAELRGDADADELRDLIRARTGECVDAATCTMISAFTAHSRLATRMVSRRSIVVGDAAHEISPIGGQGMNLGWLDAAALAPILASAILRSRAQRQDGGPAAADPANADLAASDFAGFERSRLRSARSADRQARVNMALGSSLSGIRLVARNGALRIALATPLRTAMARAFTMRRL